MNKYILHTFPAVDERLPKSSALTSLLTSTLSLIHFHVCKWRQVKRLKRMMGTQARGTTDLSGMLFSLMSNSMKGKGKIFILTGI